MVPHSEFVRLADGNRLISKAWDDRVGCALIVEVLEPLSGETHQNVVYGVWTPWEEMGRANATVEMPEALAPTW